jgi:hypothetical protein
LLKQPARTKFRRCDGIPTPALIAQADPHPEERAQARVSKDGQNPGRMVRDAQDARLAMRNIGFASP